MVSKNPRSLPLIIFASSLIGMMLAPCIGCTASFNLLTSDVGIPFTLAQTLVLLAFALPPVIVPIFAFSRLVAPYSRARVATLVYAGVVIISLPLWLMTMQQISAYWDTAFHPSPLPFPTLNVLSLIGLLLAIHPLSALLIARYFRRADIVPA